ncbi:MAG: sigma factor-like helix-turn-helix DNA-binding protein [Clostridia bacterium]
MNIEERVEIAILMKYYGKLLTDKQQGILSMYVDNNLSLAEVSAELNITRQAVKDALDTSYTTLKNLEEKLGFISRDEKLRNLLENKPLNQIDMATRLEIIALLEDN